jgi:YfiH family protein
MATHLFTGRAGGVSFAPYESFNLAAHVGDAPDAVVANRKILADRIALPSANLHFMNQVHGREVAIVDHASTFATPTADALFTTMRSSALVVLTADCVPLLLESEGAIAAVHVGRAGLVVDVIGSTLAAFGHHGISPGSIRAYLGASICGNCYEVALEIYREVTSIHPATATSEELHRLDIASGVRSRLTDLGVLVEASSDCTCCTPGYFSFRRDGVTGRQAGVIWL